MGLRKSKKSYQLYLIFMFFALLLALAIISIGFYFFSGSAQKIALENGVQKLNEREVVFQDFLINSENSMLALREYQLINDYLFSRSSSQEVERVFVTLMKANANWMQIRYIDKTGMENIRVERLSESALPTIVPKSALQDKSNRDYFLASTLKPFNQVWFSALDLNIENGKVGSPNIPTLRAVLPVAHKGEFAGIFIINYFMQSFVERLINAPLYNMVIFNDVGDVLYHFDTEKSWSAYRVEPSILKGYKELNAILEQDRYKSDKLVSKRFDVAIEGGLRALLQLNPKYMNDEDTRFQAMNISIAVIVFFLSVLMFYFIVQFFRKLILESVEITTLNKKLKEQSFMDELTQLYNRKYFNKRVEELFDEYSVYGTTFSMAMIDIDDFKKINDSYGHDVGDRILIELGQVFKEVMRVDDYACRFGGEEFIILMKDTKLVSAHKVCDRLQKKLALDVSSAEGIQITLSIGLVEINDSDDVKSLFKRADDLLYFAKKNGKNQIKS